MSLRIPAIMEPSGTPPLSGLPLNLAHEIEAGSIDALLLAGEIEPFARHDDVLADMLDRLDALPPVHASALEKWKVPDNRGAFDELHEAGYVEVIPGSSGAAPSSYRLTRPGAEAVLAARTPESEKRNSPLRRPTKEAYLVAEMIGRMGLERLQAQGSIAPYDDVRAAIREHASLLVDGPSAFGYDLFSRLAPSGVGSGKFYAILTRFGDHALTATRYEADDGRVRPGFRLTQRGIDMILAYDPNAKA